MDDVTIERCGTCRRYKDDQCYVKPPRLHHRGRPAVNETDPACRRYKPRRTSSEVTLLEAAKVIEGPVAQ